MNNIFLISFALLLVGGQLGRIQLNNNLAIYLHECLMVIYLIFNLPNLKKIFLKLKKINKNKKIIFFALFINVLIATIYSIINQQFFITSLLYLGRFLIYWLFIILIKKQFGSKKIQQLFLNISLGWLMLGFLQYFFLPDLTSLYYLGFDDHFYRLTSTLLDPGFMGLIFVFNLLFYLNQKKITQKNIWLTLLFLIALLLTYSRASYLSLLISGGYLFWQASKKRRIYLISVIALMLISLPFLPRQSGGEGVKLSRDSTIKARLINLQSFTKHNQGLAIIVGQGPFNPNYQNNPEALADHAHFADNFFVFLYNGFGLLGGSIALYCLIKNTWQLQQKRRFLAVSIIIAWLIHSQFHSNITQGFVLLSLGILLLSKATDEIQL